ncbi:aldo/keto reductase [Streptomyces aureus]|uniref:aldo/keto reductase n=1 Tax=Streptomyces aureus TaxID=193461 RepID=UPI00055D7322|nr:aldo/keto reductase [Streptomyces aureus]
MTAALALGTYRLRNAPSALRWAASAGADWIDTAPNYLHGQAQSLLAPVLADHPYLGVATKVGFATAAVEEGAVTAGVLRPGTRHSLDPAYVRWQTDRNRAQLGREHLDAVFIHNPERAALRREALHDVLRAAFAALEAKASVGHIGAYGIATWHGFTENLFTVEILDRLATEAAGTTAHHLGIIQLPVNLVVDTALTQALDQGGPIAEAAARGWAVHASAPLHGGELPDLATAELAALLRPGLSTAQACLLAAASCPGVSKVLLSASTAAHWDAARAALAEPPIPADALRKVLDVLAPHQPC